MSLRGHRRDWEDLAAEDLYWSILSDPAKRFGGWSLEEFRESGQREIDALLAAAETLHLPAGRERALDFGCGAGRLTRALSSQFDEVVGVDISERMLEEAREMNADRPSCRFVLNDTADLRQFGDAEFDLVYSSIVLQHVDDLATIQSYIREFVRVLRPNGLAAFQLITRIPRLNRLQPRRRAYHLLRAVGVPRTVLFRRLNLQPIAIRAVPEQAVREAVDAARGRIVEQQSRPVNRVVSSDYFVTRPG